MPPGIQSVSYEVRFGNVDCVEGSDASANCLPGTVCQIYSAQVSLGTCVGCVAATDALPNGAFPICEAGQAFVCNSAPSGCAYASGPFWCCP